MKQLESKLQSQCVKWFRLQYPNETIFAIPNGGQRNITTAKRLKDEGVLSGVADLFVLHGTWNFNGLFIEMKIGKGKQTESQIEFEQKAKSKHYKYVVCRSFEDFIYEVTKYFNYG
jgi:hypothetical protein